MNGEIANIISTVLQYLISGTLLAVSGWIASRFFRSYALPIRALAFVGGVSLFISVLHAWWGNLLSAVLAFGTIAVLDHLRQKN